MNSTQQTWAASDMHHIAEIPEIGIHSHPQTSGSDFKFAIVNFGTNTIQNGSSGRCLLQYIAGHPGDVVRGALDEFVRGNRASNHSLYIVTRMLHPSTGIPHGGFNIHWHSIDVLCVLGTNESNG